MFLFLSIKFKFLLRSISFFFPIFSSISNRLLAFYLKLEFNILFYRKDYIFYRLTKNRIIKLYKHSFLTKLILNDFEYEELAFVKQILQANDIVFDIGANIGIYSLLSSNYVGESGLVYAFEPVDSTYKKLLENIKANQIANLLPYNIAVSDKSNEILTIYKNDNGYDVFDSMVTPLLDNAKEIKVSTVSLDDFITQQNVDVQSIKLIKIDVEGWEFNVLQGAKKLLEAHLPIAFLVEFSKENVDSTSIKNKAVYDYMRKYQYEWYSYNVQYKKLVYCGFNVVSKGVNLIAINDAFKKINASLFID